jgi:site-specific recombinase XerD
MITDTRAAPPVERMTLRQAADNYLRHVEHVMERKASTVQDYRIMVGRHFEAHFGARGIDKLGPDDVANYMHVKAREGLSSKTISNHLTFLHGVFAHAVKRGWANRKPCRRRGPPPHIER